MSPVLKPKPQAAPQPKPSPAPGPKPQALAAAKSTPVPPLPAKAGPKLPADQQAMGNLNWGNDPATGKPWTPAGLKVEMARDPSLAKRYAKLFGMAQGAIDNNMALPAVHDIKFSGYLNNDPQRKPSQEAVGTFDDIFALSQAARLGDDKLAKPAATKAIAAVMKWASTYKPTGHPINELSFIQLFQSIDALVPLMSPHQVGVIRPWVHKFIEAADHFHFPGSTKVNNWYSWSLAIRGVAAQTLGNLAEVKKTSGLVDKQLGRTIQKDGSSFDFHERDALHYHTYDLDAFTQMATLAPGALGAKGHKDLARGYEFLRPYYEGKKTHQEFVNSKVGYDRYRASHGMGEYAPHTWDPKSANNLMTLAAGVLPETQAWGGADKHRNTKVQWDLNNQLHKKRTAP